MEKFFDLKEFLILILKKLKFIITVTLLVTVLFGIYRTYPLVNQYLTYQPHTGDTAKEENSAGLLYTHTAKKNYVINNSKFKDDMNDTHLNYVTGVLSSLQKSDLIVQKLYETYFDQVKKWEADARIRLVDLNYQLPTILTEEYTIDNFRDIFSINISGVVVEFNVATYSKSLSEKILDQYIALVLEQAAPLIDQKLDYISSNTAKIAPVPATSNPRTNMDTNTSIVRPTLRDIAVKAVKSGVLGVVFGLLLSIVLIFFVDIMDIRLQETVQLQKMNLTVLSGFRSGKKKRSKRLSRFIDKLEGYPDIRMSVENCGSALVLMLTQMSSGSQPVSKLLLTGTADKQEVEQLQKAMTDYATSHQIPLEVFVGQTVLEEPNCIEAAARADAIILVEEKGVSRLPEIENERKLFTKIHKDIIGCVVLS